MHDTLDVLDVMRERQYVILDGFRLNHLDVWQFFPDALTQPAVLGHWKPMTLRERKHEAITGEDLHEVTSAWIRPCSAKILRQCDAIARVIHFVM